MEETRTLQSLAAAQALPAEFVVAPETRRPMEFAADVARLEFDGRSGVGLGDGAAGEFARKGEGEGENAARENAARRKRTKKLMAWLSASALTTVVVFSGAGLQPAPGPVLGPAPAPVPDPEPLPPTDAPALVVDGDKAELWPLGDGTITVTVYADDFDFDTMANHVLMQVTMPEADFTEPIPMPDLPVAEGYNALGFAAYYGNVYTLAPTDHYVPGDPEVCFVVGAALTPQMAELIPPSADGVRYVNIHVAWTAADTETMLILQDGHGNIGEYVFDGPLASSAVAYLCMFATQDYSEDYRFHAWYDAAGNRVVAVSAEDVWTRSIEGGETVWRMTPVTLYAGYAKVEAE